MKIEKRNHITYFFFLKESDDDDDDSDVDVAEDDVASDGFDFSDSEWIINLPLSSGQRKLYDDYLSSASSRKALDSLDAESIAKVCTDYCTKKNQITMLSRLQSYPITSKFTSFSGFAFFEENLQPPPTFGRRST